MPAQRLNLTRDQLAQFLTDHQQIRQFELLFATVDQIAPDVVNEVSIAAGSAQATANDALAQLTRLASAVELLAAAPTIQNNNSIETDYVDLALNIGSRNAPARLNWNAVDGTANIGFGFGGVVNQIGQELCFPPLYNDTGGAIDEGTVIGITGFDTGGGGLTFVKYIADGTLTNIRAIATTTSDMANGARGFATRSGYIRTLDTTGTPYGEVWAVSDILYASATVLGGLTNVRPAAPNLIAAIGLVTVVSSTVGVLLMLVSTIQTPVQYGVFSDTTDQAIGAANTPQTITFDTTDVSQGVTIGAPTSRIYIDQAGVYNFQFSLQLTSSVGASRTISIWPRINGADVTNSATEITISSNTAVIVPAWNFVFNMAANDYFELVWASSGNNVQLEAVAVQAAPFVRPAIPSAILTVSQVNQ